MADGTAAEKAASFLLDPQALGRSLLELRRALEEIHGAQGWWPARHSFEMCAGAILVQNTAWANARKALDNLARRGVASVEGVASLSEAELAGMLRPSGYYNQKAAKLARFCGHVLERYGGDLGAFLSQPLDALRIELLSLWGIGDETADSIVLYAAKQPSFVVDTYTQRTLERIGMVPAGIPKPQLRRAVMRAIPADIETYAELHALLVQHGKSLCRTTPLCGECPLLDRCRHGAQVGLAGALPVRRDLRARSYWSEG